MKNRRLSLQNAAIYLIIIVTFFGNALFFISLNTDTLRSSIETDTSLVASVLSGELKERLTPEDILSRRFSPDEEQLFHEANPGENCEVWIIDPAGEIYCKNGAAAAGSLFADSPVSSPSALEAALRSGSASLWIGEGSLLLLQQQCCCALPLYGGELSLVVVNHCSTVQAMQRRQLSLLIGIDLVLVFATIVLIDNIISKYRKQLIRLATTDELTGLSNRKSFHVEFAEYMERERHSPCALFLLDVDFFKQINDSRGHAAGDHVLHTLADRLRQLVSAQNGFAGRWGGDEFIGVLPVTGAQAHAELEEFCRQIAACRLEDGTRFTVSIGVTDDGGETSLKRLSERADLALYHSKEKGRNAATLYTPEMAGVSSANAPAAHVPAGAGAAGSAQPGAEKAAGTAQVSPAARGESFRERMKRYIREKLIDSTIYGVRWMAPFVAGGGILIALAFLFDAASVDLSTLTVAERSGFGSLTPLAATLKNIGGITFNFMLPVFAGSMAYGIAGENAFMAGFAGGYMTINSNSGFVGAMIAGFAAGVIANEIQQFTRHLPRFVRRAAPIILYPVFNLLLMQAISWLIITPVSTAVGELFIKLLETTAARSHAAAGALSGMMMATDMGGIINKVAYNYGVGHILQGQADLMAAIMLGGMVPPIAIFLSMLLFRSKYTEYEWERGYGTLFMGLSFITEGALPYVFTDIYRMIPACMAGSAVGGLLSVLFGCELPAPHGGVFVFPVMVRPVLFAVALLIGSLVAAVILGVWKTEKR